MLLLIWFVVGLLLGIFVNRRAVALSLSATLWVISGATISARSGYLLPLDAASAGYHDPGVPCPFGAAGPGIPFTPRGRELATAKAKNSSVNIGR